jgi:hypothetical protein
MENFKYHKDAVSKESFQKICVDMPEHSVTVSCREVEQGLIVVLFCQVEGFARNDIGLILHCIRFYL